MVGKCTGFFLLILFVACRQHDKPNAKNNKTDTSTSFTNIFDSSLIEHVLDSLKINGDTARQEFYNFYRQRNYQYAWVDENGLGEQAGNFMNLQFDFGSKFRDSSLDNKNLEDLFNALSATGIKPKDEDSLVLHTELNLTAQFFKYALKAYKGSNLNAKELGWFIPVKKMNVTDALDSLISNKGKRSEQYEPISRQVRLMEDYLVKYYDLQTKEEWKDLQFPANVKKYKTGDKDSIITGIKHRLYVLGHLPQSDSTPVFNKELVAGVKDFQQQYGLTEDGVIGAGVMKQLNVSPAKRVEQLLINMERQRWMPTEPTGDFIVANIPEYKLDVYEQGQYKFTMNVVVGTAANSTVIFTGNLRYIVFSPYWNIPPDILRDEVLPGMKNKKNYLAKNNMEIAGYTGTTPNIRQKPGGNNSLGRVKFLFPNSHNIYLHDTPFKDRFNATTRSFSHGCIRLSDPTKLAKFLLRDNKSWSDSTIKKAMNAGVEKTVTLQKTVPVYITYFTAWVDREGRINFRDDIYGHDKKMAQKLFGQ